MSEDNIFENVKVNSFLPSLLTEDELRSIIRERGVKINNLNEKSRNELSEIYTRYLMPLPQRTFPNTHRGKHINNMIRKENAIAAKNVKEDPKSTYQYGFSDKSSSTLLGKRSASSMASPDRLKPPIDSSQIGSKRIALTRRPSSESSMEATNVEDKSETNSPTKVDLKRTLSSEDTDASPTKKSRQRIAWP